MPCRSSIAGIVVSSGGKEVSIGGNAGIVESIGGSDISIAGRAVSSVGKLLSMGGRETSMAELEGSSVCVLEGIVVASAAGSEAGSAADCGSRGG